MAEEWQTERPPKVTAKPGNGDVKALSSGVWARPGAGVRRRQEGPLGGAMQLPVWLGWCAALLFCVGVAAIVLGTLLHLTHELVELGHPGVRASVDER